MCARSITTLACILFAAAGCQHRYFPGDDGNGGGGGNGGNNGGADLAVDSCGLSCQINHSCAGGAHTTLTGRVYAPNGTLPLYNAIVYVPSAPVDPFPSGVTCDRCDGSVSGKPLALALTGPDGGFTLVDVPTGSDIPLVIQLGHWRRQVTIPVVTDCQTTAIQDPNATRLPRNAAEGDIPKMAIATGSADPFECLLLKIGLDAQEVTAPSGTGRVHFFRATNSPGTDLATPAPTADKLYSSLPNLLNYDVLLLPCEGSAYDKSQVGGTALTPNPRTLMQQYLDAGGRIFSTHYSYDWLTYDGSPYNKISAPQSSGLWPVGQPDDYNNTITAPLNVAFPKGADFARWLGFAGATSPPNTLHIDQGRHDVTGIDPTYATPWATYDFRTVGSGPGVMHFTFNTPLDPAKDDMGVPLYCGRAVFSDFHVTAGALQSGSLPYPSACKLDPMTDQEKALAFMLFDLSSCVQQDSTNPIP